MAFYVYVPNSEDREDGYVSNAFEERVGAEAECSLLGPRARIIEGPKPSYRHLYAFIEKGWTKCPHCGRATPPWRQVSAEVESAK